MDPIPCPHRRPGAGPLALGDHRRVRARRDHALGLGPRLPAIKTDLGIGTGHDRAAAGGRDRRGHRRTARVDPGLALAGRAPGRSAGALCSSPPRSPSWALALIVKSVPLVAVALVITGAGIGTLDVLINVEGSAVERTAGRTLLPSMHAAWSIGAAVGSGIGAACAALGITPATQLIGEAVLIAAAAFWVAAGIPAGQHGPAAGPPQDRAARLRQWLRGWLDWRLLLIGVVMLGVRARRRLRQQLAHPGGAQRPRPERRGRRAVLHRLRRQRGAHPAVRRPRRRPPRARRAPSVSPPPSASSGSRCSSWPGTRGSSSSGWPCGRSASRWASRSACPPPRRAGRTRPPGSAWSPPSAISPTWPGRPPSAPSPSP